MSDDILSHSVLKRLRNAGFRYHEIEACASALRRAGHEPDETALIKTLELNYRKNVRKRLVPIDWEPTTKLVDQLEKQGYPKSLVMQQVEGFLLKAWSDDVISINGAFKAYVVSNLPSPLAIDENGWPVLAVKHLIEVENCEWSIVNEFMDAYTSAAHKGKETVTTPGFFQFRDSLRRRIDDQAQPDQLR